MERYAVLKSTGCYLPEHKVTNDDLRVKFAHLPEFVDKMEASSGIRNRWLAPREWAASDIAVPAAQQAIAAAGLKPEDIDLIILGTDSPDYITPATSVVLQHKLGAVNAGTFDIGCACASFPTAFATASAWIAANPAIRNVLVVGVYMMSKLTADMEPTGFFYGDGAGTAVLVASDKPGFIGAAAQAGGAYHHHWGIYSGGTFEPASVESVQAGRTTVKMLDRYPPEINHEGWPRLTRKLAANCGFGLDEIDFIIFTQVRKASIELVMKDLGIPMEKTHTVMEEWGYTGSACIPMALHDAIEKKKIKSGDRVVLVGSGVGYNQAACAFFMS